MPEPVIRPATPRDRDGVLELLAATFGAGSLVADPEFWRWKHELSPFGPSPCLVATDGGRLVALRAFLPWRFASPAGEVRAVRAVDTATHPAWRGRGLFRRLTLRLADELASDGVCFVFNTPNRRSLPGYLSMGWREVGRVPVWIRAHRPARLLRSIAAPGPTDDEGAPLPDRAEVASLLAEPALPDLLSPLAAGEARYHTPRTPAYLEWRYGRVPRLTYGARWRLRPPGLAAVVFRRKLRRGLREMMLSEVLVGPGDAGVEAAAGLLETLMNEHDVDVVTAVAAPATPEAAALRRAGLRRLPGAGPRWVVRSLRAEEPPAGEGLDPTRLRSWRPSLGDLELF